MIWGVDIGVRGFYAIGITKYAEKHHYLSNYQKLDAGKTRYAELRTLAHTFSAYVNHGDTIWIEEPPYVRDIRVCCQLNQTAASILSATGSQGYLVPVGKWKKVVLGDGSASKSDVARWLQEHHPDLFDFCRGSQDLMDAACIALYGLKINEVVGRVDGTDAGYLDLSL